MKKIDNVYLNENKRIINKPSTQTANKLNLAKKVKNDEFYTPREVIEEELRYYFDSDYDFDTEKRTFTLNPFENKVVFLNCDDPKWSQFWFYFHAQF